MKRNDSSSHCYPTCFESRSKPELYIGQVHAAAVLFALWLLCSEEAASDLPHSYTTARTLLSILRIGQSLARLRFADYVEQVRGRHLGGLTYKARLRDS